MSEKVKLTIELTKQDIKAVSLWAGGQEDSIWLNERLISTIKKAWGEQGPLEVEAGQIVRRKSDGEKGFVVTDSWATRIYRSNGTRLAIVPKEGLKRSEWTIEYAG